MTRHASAMVLFWVSLAAAVLCAFSGCPTETGDSGVWFTVSFDAGKGSPVPSVRVGEGKKIPEPAAPAWEDALLLGWYTGNGLSTGNWKRAWIFGKNTVHEDMTLYAKWAESLSKNAGVWRSDGDWASAYLLLDDDVDTGTAWYFDRDGVRRTEWTRISVDGLEAVFSGDGDNRICTRGTTIYRRSLETKAPQGDSRLQGRWISVASYAVLELYNDGLARYSSVVDRSWDPLELKYRVEGDNLYLLEQNSPHRALMSIPIYLESIGTFIAAELPPDPGLYGAWVLSAGQEDTESEIMAAYTFDSNGEGTYHLWGAELPLTYMVTKAIGNPPRPQIVIENSMYYYELSGDALLVDIGQDTPVAYQKAALPPIEKTCANDTDLYGRWEHGEEAHTQALTFREDGIMEYEYNQRTVYTRIWKVDDGVLYIGSPNLGVIPAQAEGIPYSIAGSILIFDGENWQKR